MRWTSTVVAAVAAVVGMASVAGAQGIGIGPRLSFVRGDIVTATPSERLLGGTLRMASSKHVVFEAALDFRGELSADGLTKVTERPLQGSMLLFPVRGAFSPYVLGGYGLYSQTTESLGPSGLVLSQVTEKKTGWHLGFGAELLVARHAALFADYRYRFVQFGTNADPDSQPINLPGTGSIPGLKDLKLSHQGTMWTSGVAFYF